MRNIIKLTALVVIAALGAFVIRAMFVAASQPGASAPSEIRVRAAAADLPGGLLLRESDLVWKTVSRSQLPSGALVEGEAGNGVTDIKGYLLRHAVPAGALLGVADVMSPAAPGFLAAALKPDMRAISVAVDDVSSNAGLIQPGDYVDVLLTQQMRAEPGVAIPPSRMVESETVAARVRVLAVGSAIVRPKDDSAAANTNARTVTVEVTPHGAQAIRVAAHLGSLSLALRSFAMRDRQIADRAEPDEERTGPVWAGDVSRALRSLPSAPSTNSTTAHRVPSSARPAEPQVVIYRGSSAGQSRENPGLGIANGTPVAPPVQPGPAPVVPPAPAD